MTKHNQNKQLQIRNSTAEFLIFANQTGNEAIEVRLQDGTVWLPQKLIAILFDVEKSVITKHLNNIYKENELNKEATCAFFAQVQTEGSRTVGRIVNGYLDFAEEYAKRQVPLTIEDWAKHMDLILQVNEKDLLKNAGKITAALAKQHAENEFEKYRPIQDRLFESDFDKALKMIEKNNS
ncbi:MAG: virulence RhuM family protein [Tannerella sp.]|jgi:hypothetical protein|nr:virulence RhuM family protein [Tannerella sp.]